MSPYGALEFSPSFTSRRLSWKFPITKPSFRSPTSRPEDEIQAHDISASMSEIADYKTHQLSTSAMEKEEQHTSSHSNTTSQGVEQRSPQCIGIMFTPALAAVFGALIYLIRASNFADVDTDWGLQWGIPMECLVWSSAILMLAWRHIRELMKG